MFSNLGYSFTNWFPNGRVYNVLQNMWYPSPVLIPFYFEPNLRRSSDVSTTMMWQMVPFEHHMTLAMNEVVGHSLSVDARTFLLNKSIFDLVKDSRFLELTDPKLLSWYLSLSVEDSTLIQEQGGLLDFLQRHPALEVSRRIVHLKQQIVGNCLPLPGTDMSSNLNKSRRPTFYGVLQCLNCGTSCPSGAKKCRRCNELILNSEENVGILEEEKTLGLLPGNVREELDLLNTKNQDAFVRSPDHLRCAQSTSGGLPSHITFAHGAQQDVNGIRAAQPCPEQQEMHSRKAQLLSQMWEEGVVCDGTDVTVYCDPSAQASFLLDVELDMQSREQINGTGQGPIPAGTEADFTRLDQETLPKYYSFNSAALEHSSAHWSDATESLEPHCSYSTMTAKGTADMSAVQNAGHILASDAENCTCPDSVSCVSNSSEWTDFTEDYQDLSNEDELRCEPKVEECRTAVDGGSNLVTRASQVPRSPICVHLPGAPFRENTLETDPASKESFVSVDQHEPHVQTTTKQECDVSPVHLVSQAVNASSDIRDCFTSNPATEISKSFFARPCRDVASGSESFTINHEQETQTVQVSSCEKCTITEVYMSDLDVLSEELGKLKMVEKEFNLLKDTVSSCSSVGVERAGGEGQQKTCPCDANQRARRAELHLLTLQLAMCLQHCWRRYYTSPQGEAALQGSEAVPDVMVQTLKRLEEDYFEAKMMILEGVPLENLKPLSVDSQRIAKGTCYTPALISKAYLGDVLLEASCRIPGSLEDEDELGQAGDGINSRAAERGTTTPQADQAGGSNTTRVLSGLRQQPVVSCETMVGVPKELSSSEAWFDAEEELMSSGQICKEQQEAGWRDGGKLKLKQKDNTNEKKSQVSLLCITGLSSSVTECELLLWFEKYHASQVCITTFDNNSSAAMVTVRSPVDAKAAVREVNGQSIQGHTLHVEYIQGPPAGGGGPIKQPPAGGGGPIKQPRRERPSAAYETGPAGQRPSMHSSRSDTHFSRPFRCSLDKLTNICDTPTASGTCVPEHYATMGSFDTIMARLSERHPEVSRKRIVGALLELRAKHQHVLSGLPLREIVEMTSALLTESTTK
ncbi:RNA-binding protein 44 isoform X2 [Brachyhypopomus gauderio]|uniref:RNA-binding protein 44 isoform X2 n=1 Tax=Brachyhypopomus gauderio TaxID=698409 RepID=UPI004042980C